MRISIKASINTKALYRAWYRVSQISSMALLLTALSSIVYAATDIPGKGMTQDQVRSNFGEPKSTKPPVGKPAISRWDYENYSVYFENKYVIHSFQHDQKLRPRLNPEASTRPAKSQSEQSSAPGASQQEGTSQPAPHMPASQDSEAQVSEEIEQTEQKKQASQKKIEEEVEQDMQAAASKEKDLNFEEDPENTDYGKWEY